MTTNKCQNCGAMIETAQTNICSFCGFTILNSAAETQQIVQIVKTQNHEFEAKLALAENMATLYFQNGPKAVKAGAHNEQKGFNAVLAYYADAEHVGGHEPAYWLSLGRFYVKAVLHEFEQGRAKLYCLEKIIASYTLDLDNAIKFSHTGKDALIREKAENIELLRNELSKYPQKKPGSATGFSIKGCYIATSVYGSYDCPQVWTLRRYRDSKLSASSFGRLFIRFYYKISPTLVRLFGDTRLFKGISKRLLDRKVKKLQKAGFSNTPYND